MKRAIEPYLLLCVVLLAVAEKIIGGGLDVVAITNIPEPGYMAAYVDPAFKTTVTRTTGTP